MATRSEGRLPAPPLRRPGPPGAPIGNKVTSTPTRPLAGPPTSAAFRAHQRAGAVPSCVGTAPGGDLGAPLTARLAAADANLRAAAVGQVPGVLGERLQALLSHGRRLSTKVSYDGKQRRFIAFCTETLPNAYGLRPRSRPSRSTCKARRLRATRRTRSYARPIGTPTPTASSTSSSLGGMLHRPTSRPPTPSSGPCVQSRP